MSTRRKFDLSIFINDASLTEINLVKKSVIEHLQIDTDVSFSVVETTLPGNSDAVENAIGVLEEGS